MYVNYSHVIVIIINGCINARREEVRIKTVVRVTVGDRPP